MVSKMETTQYMLLTGHLICSMYYIPNIYLE
jgi:hypothetical protein